MPLICQAWRPWWQQLELSASPFLPDAELSGAPQALQGIEEVQSSLSALNDTSLPCPASPCWAWEGGPVCVQTLQLTFSSMMKWFQCPRESESDSFFFFFFASHMHSYPPPPNPLQLIQNLLGFYFCHHGDPKINFKELLEDYHSYYC